MNLDQAREIFEHHLRVANPDCALIEDATREYPSCFVFFYQSKKFVDTGDHGEMLVGHGPVLVSRQDGGVFETGSVFSVCHYVNAFQACGDPSGKPTAKVKIFGWRPRANKVRAIQLTTEHSGMGLSQAKAVIDNALLNEATVFAASSLESAERVVMALNEIGFDSVQLWSNQC